MRFSAQNFITKLYDFSLTIHLVFKFSKEFV
jgi:hypothetical protein